MNKWLAAPQATRCRSATYLRLLIFLILSAVAPTAQGASVPFVSSHVSGSLRNDITALLGMKITVGRDDLTVTHLGRLCIAGNTANHTLKLIRASDQSELATVVVSLSGTSAGQFAYGALSTPITLLHSNSYYVVSEEVQGGDRFYHIDTQVATSSAATIDSGVLHGNGYIWWVYGSAGYSYGLVDFKHLPTASTPLPTVRLSSITGNPYQASANLTLHAEADPSVVLVEFFDGASKLGEDNTSPFSLNWNSVAAGAHNLSLRATDGNGLIGESTPQALTIGGSAPSGQVPFVDSFVPRRSRNDFTGLLGMEIVVGSQPLTVTALGRYHLPGNSRSHLVKLVRSSDRLDVPGAAVQVALNAPGQFQYASLPSPVTLIPNGRYLLVSEETAGGDAFYDFDNALKPGPGGTITGSAYSGSGYPWAVVHENNQGYGPLNLQYAGAGGGPVAPSVSITSPSANASFTQPGSITIEAFASGGVNVVEFYDQGVKIGQDNSAPFQFQWLNPAIGSHQLTAVATANGQTATSTPISITIQSAVPAGTAPTITLSSPIANSILVAPPQINLEALTSTNATQVQFLVDNVLLGTDTSKPFGLVWNNPTIGLHTISAIAAESGGLTTTSAPINITVVSLASRAGRFIQDTLPGTLRQDFNGWIGYRFTVKNQAIQVTALGRYVALLNNRVHQLKLVRAADGQDIVTLSLSTLGAIPGQYQYATLASPVTLNANTSYYLVSEELPGGDFWHDMNTGLTGQSIASLDGPVYFSTGWNFVATPDRGFGPVDFQFGTVVTPPPQPPTISFTAPANGSTHTNPAQLTLQATASASTTKVEFFDNTTKLGEDFSAPFAFVWNAPALGAHTLRAIATANNGLTATSGPVQITIVAPPPPPPPASTSTNNYILSALPGSVRNDFNGLVGMQITIGPDALTVNALGRMMLAGNSGTHTLKVVRASDKSELASVSLSMAGSSPNQFRYASLANAVTLAARTTYYLVSDESNGGDSWYDVDSTLIPATVATLDGPVYNNASFPWTTINQTNRSFVPVDFKYVGGATQQPVPPAVSLTRPAENSSFNAPALLPVEAIASSSVVKVEFYDGNTKLGEDISSPFGFDWSNPSVGNHTLKAIASAGNGLSTTSAPVHITIQSPAPPSTGTETSFVVSKQLGSSRNNYDGFLGMVFTVGANPITVTELARLHSQGDSRTHTVKLVHVNGTDVTGGAVQISMNGGSPGSFIYGELAAPIALSAHTTYFLVSQETAGGDHWHDVVQTYITGTDVATVDSGIYGGAGSPFVGGGLPGQSFVPVDFKYLGVINNAGPSVSISSPSEGALLIEPASVNIQVETSVSVTKVEFHANGTKLGEDTTAPFSFVWNNPADGAYTLTAKASDGAGQSATSAPVHLTIALTPSGTEKEFIIGADSQDARNNFDGYLGMEITLGPDPITVTHLGRLVLPGNSQSHHLKIVNEKDGTDIPGAATTVSLAGGTVGQFAYAALPAPITLQAHELYFIVCQETIGGDQWCDVSRTVVTNTSVASVDGGVFGAPWRTGGLPHHSFGPVGFKYLGGASSIRPSLSIISPAEGTSFLVPVNLEIETEARGGITRVEFYRDNQLIGSDNSSPFSATWANPAPGHYALTTRGYTDAGQSATSGVVNVTVTTNLLTEDRAFVVGRTAGKLRHNFNGYVGMQFTVGDHPLIVTELGREFIEGNDTTRLLKLLRTNNSEVARVSLSMIGGSASQFRYAPLASPVTLAAHTTYYLVSEETVDGDLWQDFDTVVTTTPAAVVDGGIYSSSNPPWKIAGGAGNVGGPVNFRYHLDDGAEVPTVSITSPADGASVIAPADVLISVAASAGVTNVEFFSNGNLLGQDATAPFSFLWSNPPLGAHQITARAHDRNGLAVATMIQITVNTFTSGTEYHYVQTVAAGPARNDFNGFLGMTFTVGSTPLTVTQLGRMHVSGNSRTHLLKLVRASDSHDVGTISVNMVGGTPGQFRYAPLTAPITLAANTIYHLVSEEQVGADTWHDVERTTLTTSPVATLDSGVFGSGGSYTGGGLPNHSYVPLDFVYVFGTTPPAPTISISNPTNNSTFIAPSNLLIEATVGSGVTKVEFFANNIKLGEDTSTPFTFSWAQPTVGTHQLKAMATSALGLQATSAIVQVAIQSAASDSSSTSTPFITETNPQQLRSDFTGFLGMEITVGANPITVTHLGRMRIAGNSQTHIVKFVRWTTSQDVPGAAVSVDLSSGPLGQFKYQALASPVVLEANTIYRLVSQETEGGDQWYGVERTTVTPTSVATVDAGVYGGPPYFAGGLPNHSYGPVSFQYQTAAPPKRQPMLTPTLRNGIFQISLVGEGKVRLEASRDFVNWTSLGTFTLSSSPQIVEDPNTSTFPTRFYRTIIVP